MADVTRNCVVCDTPFVPRNRRVVACSTPCSRRRHNRNDDYHRHKRKLRRSVTRWTDITPAQEATMYRRTRKCKLCSCWMTNRHGRPNSKHLDHIVPLGVGGTHTHGNVRIICRTCNLRRPKDGSDYAGPVTLWAQAPGVMIPPRAAPEPKPKPEPSPLPVTRCVRCGADFPQRAPMQWHCHGCLTAIGKQAALLRADGVQWKDVAAIVGYRNIGNLHGLAVRHGNLPRPERGVSVVL